jgi:hypothetical protein
MITIVGLGVGLAGSQMPPEPVDAEEARDLAKHHNAGQRLEVAPNVGHERAGLAIKLSF